MKKTALAVGAHPDDIEFSMAGTLLLLKEARYEIHYLNLASGNCGSVEYQSAMARTIRKGEAKAAARILDAQWHPSLSDDLEILYDLDLVRKVAAIIREIKPTVILTHPPQDYMEDHTSTCRVVVTAAFTRGMPNFRSSPSRPVAEYDTTLYHCMPHGLCDQMRQRVIPGIFVNTTSTHKQKRDALAAHKSQQGWLDVSQKLNSYLLAMEDKSLEVGRMSKKFKHAEGWRRHLHYGFCKEESDPLADALGDNYLLNKEFEAANRKY